MRGKAKVEVGVQIVGRWILARLRHRRFFSLAELNAAIRTLLDELNNRLMRGWGASRRALFEQLDKPMLGSLAYVFGAVCPSEGKASGGDHANLQPAFPG